MFLGNSEHDVVVESAGVGEHAEKGGPAAPFGLAAAKRIGLDLSSHLRRRTTNLDLAQYDLFVTASDEIAAKLMEQGVPMGKIYNAQVPNPWPVQFQEDYDAQTMPVIFSAMYRIVSRYAGQFQEKTSTGTAAS
jgi:protein-tyrosine-phosphatase